MRPAVLPLLLLATPARAEFDIRALLIETARESDCVITESRAAAKFTPIGLQPEDVRPVAEAMFEAGEAVLDGSDFRLSPELCAGGEAPADGG